MSMEKYVIKYGNRDIEYTLQRKDVKNINLNVRPDMEVVVSANNHVPQDYIDRYVKDKAAWIVKHLDNFKGTSSEEVPRDYVSGETVKYLGKQYRLRVIAGAPEGVSCNEGFIYLTTQDKHNYQRKKKLLSQWLRQQAEEVFNRSLDTVYPKLRKYGVKRPGIMIRVMKARWGSCLRDRRMLQLNFELIKAPVHCIDYVVLHELLHFIWPRHDNAFYSYLTAMMPDWRERKAILDEEVVRGCSVPLNLLIWLLTVT